MTMISHFYEKNMDKLSNLWYDKHVKNFKPDKRAMQLSGQI